MDAVKDGFLRKSSMLIKNLTICSESAHGAKSLLIKMRHRKIVAINKIFLYLMTHGSKKGGQSKVHRH